MGKRGREKKLERIGLFFYRVEICICVKLIVQISSKWESKEEMFVGRG